MHLKKSVDASYSAGSPPFRPKGIGYKRPARGAQRRPAPACLSRCLAFIIPVISYSN